MDKVKTLSLIPTDQGETLAALHNQMSKIDIRGADFNPDKAFAGYSYSPLNKAISPDYIEECAKCVLAQGLMQVLFIKEEGAIIRDILPSADFVDKMGRRYPSNEWRVPYDGEYRYVSQRDYRYRAFATSINSRCNLKCMIIMGFCNTDKDNKVYTHTISVHRGNVKVIDIINTQFLETHPVLLLSSPILIAAGDEINIYHHLKKNAEGAHDTIAPVGLVAESRGYTMTG